MMLIYLNHIGDQPVPQQETPDNSRLGLSKLALPNVGFCAKSSEVYLLRTG